MRIGVAVVLMCACGNGETPTPDPDGSTPTTDGPAANTGAITEQDAQAPCEAICTEQDTCSLPDPSCVADCVTYYAGWARTDAVVDLAACTTALECDASPLPCIEAITATPEQQAFATACTASGCNFGSLCDPSFFVTRLIAPAILEEMKACLAGADCTARMDCIQLVIENHDIEAFGQELFLP